MASEEIKLVGSFKDDITPQLKKLSREMANMSRSFERFNKKIAPVTKSFAKMAMSARTFSEAMSGQRKSIESSARAMKEYSRQAGKMTSAMRKVQQQREKAMRQRGVSRAQARKGGGGGVGAPTGGGKGGKGGGVAYGSSAAKGFNSGIKSIAIGTAIGGMASQAMMRGLAGLKNLALSPFKKFGSMFMERVSDEMDDLKSAGGMFALDMDLTAESGNKKLFRDFNDALAFQEQINADMAKSASNLPGTTSQFVATNRQLTDTIQMTMEKDREKFMKFAEGQGADISAGGTEGAKNAMAKVGQNLTESVMLASAGQQGGLPMHIAIQQLLGAEKGKFKAQSFTNKFRAAFQKNPLLKNFLMRAEEEINKYEAGSAEKLEAIMDVFARATPEEQISKMRGSLSGLMESIRSGVLDPQGGFFGLSRAVSEFDSEGNIVGPLMKNNVDTLGNTLYKIGEDLKGADGKPLMLGTEAIVKGTTLTGEQLTEAGLEFDKVSGKVSQNGKAVGEFSTSTTYLFEQLRNMLANYGAVFTQIVGFLPTIFDPFAEMTKNIMNIAPRSQEMFRIFSKANKTLNEDVDKMRKSADNATKGTGAELRKQVMARGALFSMTDFLQGTGVMGDDEANAIKEKLVGTTSKTAEAVKDFDKTGAAIFKQIIGRLLDSEIVADIGKMAGVLVGGITKSILKMIQMLTGAGKGKMGNTLTKGFADGIKEAFGDMSFNDAKGIITDAVVTLLSNVIDVLFTVVLPNLLDMYISGLFQGLLTGGPISKIFALVGIISLVTTVISAATAAIGIATTVFTVISGVVAFLSANFAILSGAVGVVAIAIVAPVLAIAGIIMIGIAIFQQWNNIVEIAAGVLKIFVGAIAVAGAGMTKSLGGFIRGLANWAAGLLGTENPIVKAMYSAGVAIEGAGKKLSDEGMKTIQDGLKQVGDGAKSAGQQYSKDEAAFLSSIGFGKSASPASAPAPVSPIAGITVPQATTTVAAPSIAAPVVGVTAPQASSPPAVPSPEETGVAAVEQKVAENVIKTSEAATALTTLNTELPPAIDTSIQTATDPMIQAITAMGEVVQSAAAEVVAALSRDSETIQIGGPFPLPVNMPGLAALANTKASSKYMGNVLSAAGGMNLGGAIASEMKNKPSGSDLVIANSSETIIPAGMSAGTGGGGVSIGAINISGVDDPREIANQVAEEIMHAMQRATYSEINVS